MKLRFLIPLAAMALLALGAGSWGAVRLMSRATPFADAEDLRLANQGVRVYRRECAMCHGDRMQGQALWRLVDKDSHRRAPALDETGRAWRRSDDDLFRMVKFGRYPETPSDVVSHMPAYQSALSDRDMLAVLAFVKHRWPVSLRVMQAQKNPGERGMPAEARATDWRLPGDCLPHEAASG